LYPCLTSRPRIDSLSCSENPLGMIAFPLFSLL
jgi:hypothetical protein